MSELRRKQPPLLCMGRTPTAVPLLSLLLWPGTVTVIMANACTKPSLRLLATTLSSNSKACYFMPRPWNLCMRKPPHLSQRHRALALQRLWLWLWLQLRLCWCRCCWGWCCAERSPTQS